MDTVEAAERVAEAMIELWRRAHLEIAPEVSDQQMRTLLALEKGACGPTLLARTLRVSLSSTTRLCDRLDQRGLIQRTASGRHVTVCLTPDGERLLHATREHRRCLLARALTDTGADQAILQDTLGQLCALLAHLSDPPQSAPIHVDTP
ncbi:MarR family winged helix-turn-helix transcriptional regulator [Streptomyces sp. NPDC012825]|uniref:MarR family winged helix-turn-helix transcriptional regulator n=1 Tax=Streptomyces sp. NPDC012825 TaxID=3364851 RepID=UPI0036AA18F8